MQTKGNPIRAAVAAALLATVTLSLDAPPADAAPRKTTSQPLPIVLSGTPPTRVIAGQSYAFRPTVSGGKGSSAISFSIAGKPAWASFNRKNGTLSGTPTAANVGTYPGISISATDGSSIAMLPTFSITVTGLPNAAPAISGTPATTGTVGTVYAFTPTASDADGDALKFAVQNLPAWASFSTASGTLTGTPAAAGTWSSIVISVTDGKATTALPAFSIVVGTAAPKLVAPTGSVTLEWSPPTTNVDGTPLVGLAGYRIVYGTDPANLTGSLQIASPAITSATIESLPAGTWWFGVKAYTSAGLESAMSALASRTL